MAFAEKLPVASLWTNVEAVLAEVYADELSFVRSIYPKFMADDSIGDAIV